MFSANRFVRVIAISNLLGCGSGSQNLNQTSVTCPAGRTFLDGVCVKESVADYVACVRAQGAQLGGARSSKISADAGYAGAHAGGASEVREDLVKKYAASDAAMLEIIRACDAAAGMGAATTTQTKAPANGFSCFAYTYVPSGATSAIPGNECLWSKPACDQGYTFWSNAGEWQKKGQKLIEIKPCAAASEAFCHPNGNGGWICRATMDYCSAEAPNCVRYVSWPG